MTSKRKPRQLVLDEERRSDWIAGRTVDRTPFESELAYWAGLTPSIDQAIAVMRLAWSPAGRRILLAVLVQARQQPAKAGLEKAIRSSRRIWRDVWRDPPPRKRGRPRLPEILDVRLWLLFHQELARAREADASITKAQFKRHMLKISKKNGGYLPLGDTHTMQVTSLSQLDRRLKLFEQEIKKELGNDARRTLVRHLQRLLPDTWHLVIAAESPQRGTKLNR
jgi:hypothetical protein